jgi:hypothetical protein
MYFETAGIEVAPWVPPFVALVVSFFTFMGGTQGKNGADYFLKGKSINMNGKIRPITKMETLLVATDGSELSKNAIREAMKLAKACSSKLIAVSVVQTNLEFEEAW